MDQDALFDLLRQQGFRHFDSSETLQRSLFEWRVETIVIPHPSGEEYSPLEVLMIDQRVAKQTDHEVSITPMTQKVSGDLADTDAGGKAP